VARDGLSQTEEIMRLCGAHTKKKKIKKKSKAVPIHAMEALGGERRYSSYSFTTSALDGGVWSASRPGRALPPGKGPPVPRLRKIQDSFYYFRTII
jgi:hypothetical protein